MTPHNVSDINTTRVLRSVWLNPGISRVEISRRLGLNKSTISKIVANLEQLGIVETSSVGDAGPTGGRRPIYLQINSSWGCVMGIEIQTEAFTVIGTDLHGEIFFSHTEPLDIRRSGLLPAFVEIVNRFRPSLETQGMHLIGIGVGLPGFVDPIGGVLIASKPLEIYEPVAFSEEARARLGTTIPIMVDNDANCGCWGELAVRHAVRPVDFIFVLGELRKHTVRMDDYRIMALGLGLVIDGKVHHGTGFSAGEFRSILYRPSQVNQFSLTDAEAQRFLIDPEVNQKVVSELAGHVAFLVHSLNFERVVIGGPIEVLADELIPAIEQQLDDKWAYPGPVQCSISLSRLGDKAVAFGAAAMFLEHLITIPNVAAERDMAVCGVELLSFVPPR
jgi:predicted NBD/HSP70 family sugar kinase